jgi:hypothetical protein
VRDLVWEPWRLVYVRERMKASQTQCIFLPFRLKQSGYIKRGRKQLALSTLKRPMQIGAAEGAASMRSLPSARRCRREPESDVHSGRGGCTHAACPQVKSILERACRDTRGARRE